MKPFMDDNFLLNSGTAIDLYHSFAKDMPIIDYHCHLSPQEIYENKTFRNLTDVWLSGDHYKWRALRSNGVEERLITGDASDRDKFDAWSGTVPVTLGNPLYHWSHLELKRFFGIDELINLKNADAIWEKANSLLTGGQYGARDLITRSRVKVICTTDDPADSLEYHIKLKEDAGFGTVVLPSFRPDKGLEINRATFRPWLARLGEAVGKPIASYGELLSALEARIRFFDSVGCRVSDHALDYVPYAAATEEDAAAIFSKALQGSEVTLLEEQQYKTWTLLFLGRQYNKLGWAMQLHINASRNNNSRMFGKLGPDTGYDSINDSQIAYPLTRLLDALESEDALPKTILYSLDPVNYPILATVMGSFQGGGVAGKMQLGSAWWFNDTKDGMLVQMNTLANIGLLSRFVGMLTDSRSFLSYTRHEYFRRLLCDVLGDWVEKGEAPHDRELLGTMVQDICYRNAERYFGFQQ